MLVQGVAVGRVEFAQEVQNDVFFLGVRVFLGRIGHVVIVASGTSRRVALCRAQRQVNFLLASMSRARFGGKS
ncbi:hypothetical protein [Actinoplanes sp. NBRC 103695]|uniref:hypothetical protein n=1 Tax=Actinoplanes sp. NBRC 103695 TaxID=3032202 RepID=UPI0024A50C93|nr:hypothetical protein [Actinoplanes sp. NBRC 103695]GLZ02249.1 hypothetical protein Acsp02_95000 [Actinoplanes sp. NBRC 103695]